jgi:hypothetical protein
VVILNVITLSESFQPRLPSEILLEFEQCDYVARLDINNSRFVFFFLPSAVFVQSLQWAERRLWFDSNPTFHPTNQTDTTGRIRPHRTKGSTFLGSIRRHRTSPTVSSHLIIPRSWVRSPSALQILKSIGCSLKG